MRLSQKDIKKIADHLDAGFNVCINTDNNAIKELPSDEMMDYDGEDFFQKDFDEVEKWENKVYIEPLESWETFKFMEKFCELLDNQGVRNRLLSALKQHRPFASFRDTVYELDIKEQWFSFYHKQYEQEVIFNLPEELQPEGFNIEEKDSTIKTPLPKEHQLNLSTEEVKMLFQHLFIGDWVLTSQDIKPDKKYVTFFNTMLEKFYNLGFKEDIEFFPKSDDYYFIEEFTDAMIDKTQEYDEESFWQLLIQYLSDRDTINKYGLEKLNNMDEYDRISATFKEEEKYHIEFEKNGIKNLVIKK